MRNLGLIALLALAGAPLAALAPPPAAAEVAGGAPRVDAAEAQAMQAAGTALIVDVREGAEIRATGKIPGALHVPRGAIAVRADPRSASFEPAFGEAETIILYCASGVRSEAAAATLRQLGYARVLNLGGLPDWVAGGGAVERAP